MNLREPAAATFLQHRGRIAILMLVLVWSYFLVAFGEQAWRARELQAELDREQASIAALARENEKLQAQVDRYASNGYLDYVQAIARRDLDLANPGETVVLVRWQDQGSPQEAEEPPPPVDDRPNWKRWLDAFSDNP